MPAACDLFPSGCDAATRSHSPSNTSICNLQLIAFSIATSPFWVSAGSRWLQGKVSRSSHTVWQACCCTHDLLCRVQAHGESCCHLWPISGCAIHAGTDSSAPSMQAQGTNFQGQQASLALLNCICFLSTPHPAAAHCINAHRDRKCSLASPPSDIQQQQIILHS